jgi:cytochrome c
MAVLSNTKEIVLKAIIICLALIATPALADEASLKKNNCMACHQVERKVVGPSYKEIANKYRGQSGAADKLAKKIRAGGAGVWGPMPMPAQPHVSEIEAKKLAEYILNLK